MSCIICLRDDFTNYKGKDITWSYEGYSQTEDGEYSKVTECHLEFDGVDDYAKARNATDLNFALPIKVDFVYDGAGAGDLISKSINAGDPHRYMVNNASNFGIVVQDNSSTSDDLRVPITFVLGQRYKYEAYEDVNGDLVQMLDGSEINRTTSWKVPSASTYPFFLGSYNFSGVAGRFTQSKFYSFQVGTEIFPLNEGTGTTITGSEGTVLDIYGATWHCVEGVNFDESCLGGPNPCFDAEGMTPGYYKFTYNYNGEEGDVYLYVSGSEEAGNPVPNTYCYQGLPFEDPNAEKIDLQDHFLGATQYNIVYHGGVLDQFDGTNLEISSLVPGEYCFTNIAEKQLPEGWKYEDCKDCNDYESVCITIVEPLSAGDNRVINVCNNVDEIFYQDYLVNNDGIGQFSILEDNLTAGTLDSEKYTPDLTDVGSDFKILHRLPHPVAQGCDGLTILEFHVIDCVPAPDCTSDEYLNVTITVDENGNPSDPQWEDLLILAKTGSYEDAGVIATDEIYWSDDDGATWTQSEEVKDGDLYVKLSTGFTTTCSGGAQTGSHRMQNVTLSNGENVQEGQLRSRNGNYNANYTNIQPTDQLSASGASSGLITERYFRWDVEHILNSGWVLHVTRTHFDRGSSTSSCPSGIGSFGNHFNSGNVSGKKRILVQRRITYNNDCDDLIIENEYNPTLPECPELPSNVGFSIVDPYKIGNDEYAGSVACSGSIPGSTSDTVQIWEQPTGSNGYAYDSFSCGGSDILSFNYSYVFQRIIQFAGCPPILILRNYNAPTSCPSVGISCDDDDANSRARATRVGNPFNLSNDYMQRRIGSGSWQAYSEGQWVYVSGNQTVYFRRVANFNNGCAQQIVQCSATVTPPTHSLTISCSGNTIVVNAVNMPGTVVAYFLYRDNVLVDSNTTGANFPISQNGNYQVRYKYNQHLYIYSNTVNCGSSCQPPTVSIGACSVSGNTMTVPFTTTNITNISQITADVDPGSGSLSWNAGSGQGVMTVVGQPGQTYQYQVDVVNSCGSDTAYRTCSIGCSTLVIDDVVCDFPNNRTYFSVYVSPNLGTTPTVTGGTYIGSSGNRYDFYQSGTSGTITADHPQACAQATKSISCSCTDPSFSLSANCGLDEISYSFTVTNQANAGNYTVKVNGNTVRTITNTGAGSYSGTYAVQQGSSNTVQITTPSACGGTVSSSVVNANCGCNDPVINANASCSTDTVSYSFSVQNESQVTGNYSVKLNGNVVQTKVKNGSGSYSGTIPVTPGTNNTVQISAGNQCGGTVNSNTVAANCGCPQSSLSISNVSCNATTQMLTFTINQSNVSGLTLTVNGSPVTPGSNPQSVQGVPGQNTITVSGTDSCASTSLSDSVSINCNCTEPSLSLSATCNTSGLISYSFTVSNESRTNGNYTILIDGNSVGTKTNTGAGSYSGTYQGSSGTNYTVRIRVPNKCGGNTLSNQISTTCGCPASSLTIVSPSCNSTNQMVSFTVNSPNSTVTSMRLNGSIITGSGPWQGVIGSNEITVNGVDDCNGNQLSDTKTITCECSLVPTVQINSMSESSGVLTVNYSTSNISASSQITFKGNGTTRPVTNLGSGNWRSTFTLNEGSNSISVTVNNNCGSAMDTDTYNYSTCVAPYLALLYEGCVDGYLVLYTQALNITHADITTTPTSQRYGSGSLLEFRFNYGSNSSITWNISGSTACGNVGFGGTSSICPEVDIVVVDEGCSSSGCADFLFFLDNSGSISEGEFNNMSNRVRSTIDQIDATVADARYKVVKYSNTIDTQPYPPLITTLVNWTTSATAAKNFSRGAAGLADLLNSCLGALRSSGMGGRSGCTKHLIIFTDARDDQEGRINSTIRPYTNANLIKGDGWIISVVGYPPNSTEYPAVTAAVASVGGSYFGAVASNSGDPDGSGTKPRRYYPASSFGATIPGLIDDIAPSECQLRAVVEGCQTSGSYSWAASNGGSIVSGQGTSTIVTNGTGTYQVTVNTDNCTKVKSYSY